MAWSPTSEAVFTRAWSKLDSVDVDGDGDQELVGHAQDGLEVFDGEAFTQLEASVRDSVFGDFDADGSVETAWMEGDQLFVAERGTLTPSRVVPLAVEEEWATVEFAQLVVITDLDGADDLLAWMSGAEESWIWRLRDPLVDR
jgi:hypothetical protein